MSQVYLHITLHPPDAGKEREQLRTLVDHACRLTTVVGCGISFLFRFEIVYVEPQQAPDALYAKLCRRFAL